MTGIDFSQVITSEAKAEAARSALLSDLSGVRWERETGGITLPDGMALPTDERTIAKLTGAVESLARGMISEPISWKFPAGWAHLTKAQIDAAAAAASQHVQACFKAEEAVDAQISALDASELVGFDLQGAFDAALAAQI